VEFPALPPGSGRWSLHRRRSLLPDAQGGDAGLPPAGHSRRPAHQRRHGQVVAEQTVKQLIRNGASVKGAKALVLGLTFKEDCPDLRNSRVIDVIRELESYGVEVLVHDPVADAKEAEHEYGVSLHAWKDLPRGDAIVAAVAQGISGTAADRFRVHAEAGRRAGRHQVPVRCRALRAQGVSVWRL
jgi:UDP-N-acetyl-D-galactosamine dehydrogenase